MKSDKQLPKGRKKLLRHYASSIRGIFNKYFGHQCKDFCFGCIVCQVHRVADEVDTVADYFTILDKMK